MSAKAPKFLGTLMSRHAYLVPGWERRIDLHHDPRAIMFSGDITAQEIFEAVREEERRELSGLAQEPTLVGSVD